MFYTTTSYFKNQHKLAREVVTNDIAKGIALGLNMKVRTEMSENQKTVKHHLMIVIHLVVAQTRLHLHKLLLRATGNPVGFPVFVPRHEHLHVDAVL